MKDSKTTIKTLDWFNHPRRGKHSKCYEVENFVTGETKVCDTKEEALELQRQWEDALSVEAYNQDLAKIKANHPDIDHIDAH